MDGSKGFTWSEMMTRSNHFPYPWAEIPVVTRRHRWRHGGSGGVFYITANIYYTIRIFAISSSDPSGQYRRRSSSSVDGFEWKSIHLQIILRSPFDFRYIYSTAAVVSLDDKLMSIFYWPVSTWIVDTTRTASCCWSTEAMTIIVCGRDWH